MLTAVLGMWSLTDRTGVRTVRQCAAGWSLLREATELFSYFLVFGQQPLLVSGDPLA